MAVRNKASKVLFSIITIGILQVWVTRCALPSDINSPTCCTDSPFDSIVPIFRWPLTLLASFLQFTFLYSSGIKQLRKGFASSQSAAKVKSILTVYVVTSTLQLVPGFIFDTRYHFGALWDFFLPFVLFIVPWKDAPEQTLAASLCDTLFATLSTSIGTLFAPILPDHDGQITVSVIVADPIRLIWAGHACICHCGIDVVSLIRTTLNNPTKRVMVL